MTQSPPAYTQSWVLSAAAFLALPVAAVAPRGLSILLIVGGLAGLSMLTRQKVLRPSAWVPLRGFGIALSAVILLSAVWSVDPGISLSKGIAAVATISLGLCLAATCSSAGINKRRLVNATIVGALLGIALMCFEGLTGGMIARWFRLDDLMSFGALLNELPQPWLANRGMSIVALMAWPSVLVFWTRGGILSAVLAATLFMTTALLSNTLAPAASLIVGGAVTLGVFVGRSVAVRLFMLTVCGGVLLAPLVPSVLPNPETAAVEHPGLPSSAIHRLSIWHDTAGWISKRPILGYGFESSRTFSSEKDKHPTALMRGPDGRFFRAASEAIPLHPHNAMLQWWLELGGVGATIFAAFFWWLGGRITRLSGRDRAVVTGFVATLLVNLAVSYGAWQNWWISGIFLSVAVMAVAVRRQPGNGGRQAG